MLEQVGVMFDSLIVMVLPEGMFRPDEDEVRAWNSNWEFDRLVSWDPS